MDRQLLITLNMIPQIGPIRAKYIFKHFKTLPHFMKANKDDLLCVPTITEKIAEIIISYRQKIDYRREIDEAEKKGIKIITLIDTEYPYLLKQIYDPPPVLYVIGKEDVLKHISIAIVGTRKATPYGKNTAYELAWSLAKYNINIVSGMARGIDSIAHQGAINAEGATTAVLGSGLDIIYPRENIKLMRKILKCGCVVSNFPLGTKPVPGNFPARNRIISGLSSGIVVVEAAEKSGSLITADFALEQGREIFAVPGNIKSPYSKGTHRLIKQGAKLTENIDDILEEFQLTHVSTVVNAKETNKPKVKPDEEKVIKQIEFEPTHIEQIRKKTELSISLLNNILTRLEIKGLIKSMPGGYFMRI